MSVAGGLDVYQSKRDFSKTREPEARQAKPTRKTQELSFVIQKHAARRLHYDLRLELDGVLKSWAVARGPSLVPGEKRLAVEVEDHPLDYGTFEGTIPKGQYGGGSVLVWDRGTWTPEHDPHKGFEKGHLDFTLHGEKLRGLWHLVRLKPKRNEKRNNWLLIKSDDAEARAEDEPDILEQAPLSVKSGRPIEAITEGEDPEWTSQGEVQRAVEPSAKQPVVKGKRAAKAAPKAPKTPTQATRKKPGVAMPPFVEPCLATLVDKTPSDAKFVHEIKLDGYRIQARIENGDVALRTRTGLNWTDKFKGAPFLDALQNLDVDNALLDGEVVVEAETGHSDFSTLVDDLSTGRRDRMVYWVFDLLHLDGEALTSKRLLERKAALEPLITQVDDPALRYSEHMEFSGEDLLAHACRLGLEGLVSKRRDAPYRGGRGKDWVKSKCVARQEFVVAGFTPSTTLKKAVGALALGYYEGKNLVYAGRVGSGFNERSAREMFAMLEPESVTQPPFAQKLGTAETRGVRFVEPRHVVEVEFRGWTGGGSLRHPVFKGVRDDKTAQEIVREDQAMAKTDDDPKRKAPPHYTTKLTHPDRLLWPDVGVTKQGLADFYADIWEWIGPHIVGRPLSLVRCPEGAEGSCFFQKHAWSGMSDSVDRVLIPGDEDEQLAIHDLDGLIALVQAGVLEIHPWGSHVKTVEKPDMISFDLDPGEGVSWQGIIDGALAIRDRLAADKITSFVKTSGGKGLHIVAPLTPSADWETVKGYTKSVADDLSAAAPHLYTATLAKKARTGRIFIDYLRNGRGATAVSAYSTRARAGAPVATPIAWDELDATLRPDRYRVGNLITRLEHLRADPWADFFTLKQTLPGIGKGRRVGTKAKK